MDADSLVLFFTRGVSLQTWRERGIAERETALYRRLGERGVGVTFITYGSSDGAMDGIDVRDNRTALPWRAYSHLVPALHAGVLRRASVLKTNQVYGGMGALRSARLWRKPLVARAGFLWTEAVEATSGTGSLQARFAADRERRLMRGADIAVVTTERLRDKVVARYGVEGDRVMVIPNFVETDRFVPGPGDGPALVFVGRLAPEKNLGALIEALRGSDVSLEVVGDGPAREALERTAADAGADVRFRGGVAHDELPAILGRARAFALPSLYEGHPKAAIEAMACGLPVLGADVPGINDLVRDGETGVLAGTDTPSLRAAVERLLGDDGERARMGRNAREEVARFSLDRIVELELEAIARAKAHHG